MTETALLEPPAPRAPVEASPEIEWLVERAAVDAEAYAQLGPVADVPALVRGLLGLGRSSEALLVTACALPPREGVWWAWVAARHATQAVEARGVVKPAHHAGQVAALDAAEQWVAQPTDAYRRAAWDAARAAGLDTTAGSVAAAAFFTGGSVTPPNGPPVPPPAGTHATLAATAVLLAAMATDASRLVEMAGAFAEQGAAVVQRLGGWDAAVSLARQAYDAQVRAQADGSVDAPAPMLP